MKLLFRLCILSMFCTSCGPFLHHLQPEELVSFNVYNKSDVLIFQNVTTGRKDTTRITKKQIYRDYTWDRTSDFSHHCASLWYDNKNMEAIAGSGDRQGSMFYLSKRDKKDTVPFALSYLHSSFTLKDTISGQVVVLTLTPNRFDKVYCLSDSRKGYRFTSEKHDYDPETLFWDTDHGILKYVAYNGETWERINWKN